MIKILLLLPCLIFAQIIEIKHKAYEITFDLEIKQPLYTHYFLNSDMLDGNESRTAFTPDILIKKEMQGSAKDYKNGFYDKGHLSPNDDFKFDKICQTESMYYTNCAPQNPYLNRGIWKSLENYCRRLAENEKIEIWTCCIYFGSKENLGKLIVPTYFWKLIKHNGKYEAYKMPNITPTSKSFDKYKIDEKEFLKLIKK